MGFLLAGVSLNCDRIVDCHHCVFNVSEIVGAVGICAVLMTTGVT